MSGPQAGAQQLQGVVPGGQALQGNAGAPPLSDGDLLQHLQSAGTPPAAGATMAQAAPPAQGATSAPDQPPPSDSDLLQALGGGDAASAAPAQGPSFGQQAMDALSSMSPLVAMLHGGPSKDAPGLAEILSKVGKTPEAQRQVFANWAGKDYDTRVEDGEVQFKRKGESDWRDITPSMKTPTGLAERIAGFWPELGETLIQGGAVAAGATAGAAAGLGAAGVGAIPGGVAGASAAGAAGAATAAFAREAAARILGADPSQTLGSDVGLQAALGGVLPVVGAAIRRPAQWAATKLISAAENSDVVGAQKVGNLVKNFHDMYLATADRSLDSYAAGEQAKSALLAADQRLGDRIGLVKTALQGKAGDQTFATPTFTKQLEDTLQDRGFRMIEKPRITPSEPVEYELQKPAGITSALREGSHAELKGLEDTLAQVWNQQRSGGGTNLNDLFGTLKTIQSRANYESEAPSAVEQTYRALYSGLRQDRNDILGNLAQGTEVEGIAKSAFSDFSNKIDDLRMLSRAAEKSPEKFADWVFKDAQTAKLAKSVLQNPDSVGVENLMGWDALKNAWLLKHVDGTQDVKTGIVNLTKLAANMGKNPEVARTALGEGGLEQIKNLGLRLDRVTWKGLLANPDSEQSSGLLSALSKAVISKFHPAYAANALGAIANYDPAILKMIQEKGIMKFAEEAPTLQAKNMYLRTGKMMQKLIDYGSAELPIGGGQTIKAPLESTFLPVLLNAGVRSVNEPADQTASQQNYAMQMYNERQAARMQQIQAEMQARAAAPQPQGLPMPQLSNVGPGQAPARFPTPNIFAGRGGSALHSSGRRK